MNRRELDYILRILEKVKDPDEHINKAIAFVRKDIAIYEARRGQMREQYDVDDRFGSYY